MPFAKNFREEEARTLPVDGYFVDGPRTAIVYRHTSQPTNLRQVLVHTPKPSGDDRRMLGLYIATAVRSLHVHFQMSHVALRTESFVFLGSAQQPNLKYPYILDWIRQPGIEVYQHRDFQTPNLRWAPQIWSLLMILSEIAEWQPIDDTIKDVAAVTQLQQCRVARVVNISWKGAMTAEIFNYGFEVLGADPSVLLKFSHWGVKKVYDKLCAYLEPSKMVPKR